MKKSLIIVVIITIANIFSLNAQSLSDYVRIGSFNEIKLYENESYDLITGEYTPFRITEHFPNCCLDIWANASTRNLYVIYWHDKEILQKDCVTKIQTFANTGNSIFFVCTLDNSTELTIQCQVNEGIAFLFSYKLDVVSIKYDCDWSLLKKICNQWY